jgi:uncharacterized protein YndB with AHSA1/START domain
MVTRSSSSEDLVITRFFEAPRERVFKSWTQCDRLMRWWGPKGFTSPSCNIDFHVGGEYFSSMRSPEGQEFWSKGEFREIVAPERLVMTDSFADEKGNIVPASYYGMSGDWPLEMLISVTLEEQDGRTKLTLKHSGIDRINATDRDNMQQGWSESFDKLAESLAEA